MSLTQRCQGGGLSPGTLAPPGTFPLGSPHRMVGMTNSAPSLTPDGQREVTVFVLV
jgi:hypothetical protein